MVFSLRRSPYYVLAFVSALAAPQLVAFALQFAYGFRPFSHEPIRIPFSWDMFSNRVERCVVSWNHPLQIGQHRISSLRDVELPLEWDVIFDRREDYLNAAMGLCGFATVKPTAAHLRCFLPSGVEASDDHACP